MSSKSKFVDAQRYLAGGVNSPVRAFRAVGGTPRFMEKGSGSRIFDIEGNEYIDYVCSWGPLILGHAHPQIINTVKNIANDGMTFGAPTELETKLARMVAKAVPSIELIRFVNSGTEACMSALRLARAFTKRDKVIKFEGCYHGHADGLLVKAGSGNMTFGIPDSAGVPEAYANLTLVATYNDPGSVESLIGSNPGEIAAVIVEPVAGNMGVIPPKPGFLESLRDQCTAAGALLIFDEVISGFRASYGGAQSLFNVTPDLTCLGKIIGGGLPVGAYGGKRSIMEQIAPLGPAYQAGTLSGNPLAMAAGIETLTILSNEGVYSHLELIGSQLEQGILDIVTRTEAPVVVNRLGSTLTLFFSKNPVYDYTSAAAADQKAFANYFNQLLDQGIYVAPSQFEAMFMSLAHTKDDIDQTLEAIEHSLSYHN